MAYQQILIEKYSDYSGPYGIWNVYVEQVSRSANAVSLNVKVTVRLAASSSWVGTGHVISATVTINGTSISVPMKAYSDSWSGTSTHEVVKSASVSASASLTSLSATFSASNSYDSKTLTVSTTTCSNVSISAGQSAITVTDPSDVYGDAGNSKSFTVSASGGSGYSYKWYFNGSLVSSSGATYTRTIQSSDNGKGVYCRVSDSTGASQNSKTAYIYITQKKTGSLYLPIIKTSSGNKAVLPQIKLSSGVVNCLPAIKK